MSQGLYVKQVYVCGGTNANSKINGIRITYSDGSRFQKGNFPDTKTNWLDDFDNFGIPNLKPPKCQTLNIDVGEGERVTEIEMRGSGNGKWLARLRIKTNKNKQLYISKNYCSSFVGIPTGCKYPKEHKMTGSQLGEGIILGIMGHEEKNIRSLKFRMLRKVNSRKVTNVKFHDVPQPQLISLDSMTLDNAAETDRTKENCQKYDEKHIEERKWEESHKHLVGVGIKGTIPVIGVGINGKTSTRTLKQRVLF